MRSLILLILVWLAFQFGSLLLSDRPDASASRSKTSPGQIDEALRAWPDRSRDLAKRMIVDFGPPDGAHEDVLWWNRAGHARIVIFRDDRDAPSPRARAVTAMAPEAAGRD